MERESLDSILFSENDPSTPMVRIDRAMREHKCCQVSPYTCGYVYYITYSDQHRFSTLHSEAVATAKEVARIHGAEYYMETWNGNCYGAKE